MVTNALEWGQCCACRSVSPALHAQGLSRGAGSRQTLGPGDSGVSSASFETAREDALSRMGSAATQGVQTTYHNSPACTAARDQPPGSDSLLQSNWCQQQQFMFFMQMNGKSQALALAKTDVASAVLLGHSQSKQQLLEADT